MWPWCQDLAPCSVWGGGNYRMFAVARVCVPPLDTLYTTCLPSPAELRAPSRPPSSTSRISRPLRSPLPLHTARRAESPRLPPPRRPESPRLVSRRPESPRVTSPRVTSPRVTSPRVTSPRVPAAGRHPASTRQAWLYSTSSSGSEASTEGSTRCRPTRPGAYPTILPRWVTKYNPIHDSYNFP